MTQEQANTANIEQLIEYVAILRADVRKLIAIYEKDKTEKKIIVP